MKRVLLSLALGLAVPVLLSACEDDSAPVGTDAGGSSAASAGVPSSESAGQAHEGGAGSVAPGAGTSGDGGAEIASAGASSGGSSSGGSTPGAGSGGSSTGYLPCESKADCDAFGGGKVCCAVGAMHFCTKPSACPGDTLP